MLLLFAGSSSDATILAPEPSIPPDCYVADEPTENGPAAPSDLTAEWGPYFDGDILIDAADSVRWTDNSDNETCFVVEMKHSGASYEVVAILPANTEAFTPWSGPGVRTYRAYAAHAGGRSAYSNEDTVYANYTPPTPTPTPSASPTPSPSPSPSTFPPTPTPTPSPSPSPTPTPTPSAIPDPQPTPAALPKTGGLPH